MKPFPPPAFEKCRNETREYYDENASRYAADAFQRDLSFAMDPFCKPLIPGGLILDLGSGPGRDSIRIQERGFTPVSCDFSRGMLLEHRARGGGLLVQGNAVRLPFRTEVFSGVWCCAVLLHIPKISVSTALGEVHRVLVPDGRFFVAVKGGKGEETGQDSRIWSYFEEKELVCILTGASFRVIRIETTPDQAGRPVTWLNALAVRVSIPDQ